MANVKKNKETKETKIVEPDYTIALDCGAVIDLYKQDDDKTTCKITLYNAFVIFGRVIFKDNKPFISYPSYYSKTKKKYINQAYCFDKDIIEEINKALADIYA